MEKTKVSVSERSCRLCRHVDFVSDFQNKTQNYVCRLKPPTAQVIMGQQHTAAGVQQIMQTLTIWPVVEPNTWCGEFDPKSRLES